MSGIVRTRGLVAPMEDGVELVADAWHPEGPGPWPVLLQRLPYGRSVASSPVLPHPVQLARAGYAVVAQDVRGRGDSGGVFRPFADEARDGVATIEWAARLPFCDGRVVTYGFSYQGLNQLYAAALRPPSLTAIAPMMCSTEPYASWTYQGGLLRWPFVAAWAAQLAAQVPGSEPIVPDLEALPTRGALGPVPPPWFSEWLSHADDDAYWAALRPDIGAIDVPAFSVLGYFDDFAPGTADLIEALDAEAVCGPWAHMPWGTRTATTELGEVASSAVAHEAFFDFLDRVLRGGAAPPKERVRYFDPVAGWQGAPSWPPPHRAHVLQAQSPTPASSRHGGGVLVEPAPGEATPLGDVIAAEPLVPFPGGLDALSDESAAEDRRDVLCYTSAVLEAPRPVAGSAVVRATVRADAPTFDLVASLVEVQPDGRALRLATGARRTSGHVPDDVAEVTVDLGPLAWTLRSGTRLRLDLTASRFPAFDRNPHVAVAPADAGRSDCRVATLEVDAVELVLPVRDGTAR